jgi:hypothetical protein
MCHICGQPQYYPCNCVQQNLLPCNPCSTTSDGCPIKLDTACVIYHKSLSTPSGLEALNLPNGSTLDLILDTIDVQLRQINVPDWTLPFLDDSYVINTLEQFGTAVDSQFAEVDSQISDINTLIEGMGYLGALPADPVLADTENGQYWWRTDLSAAVALRIKVNGAFRTIPTTA